jgi:sec-independent protein translocase protein TatB
MFDIGFSELLVIAVVALIVIGPERLPKVARTVGHLIGRMQRYVNDVKADISREMELDELRKLRSSMEETARSFEESVQKEVRETESALDSVADSAKADAEAEPAREPNTTSSPGNGRPADGGTPQLDLALDSSADASTRKPA